MSKLTRYIERNSKGSKLEDLSTDAITLFDFLALVVDINYQKRFGERLEYNSGKGYASRMNTKDHPDQLNPVENSLDGSRRGLIGE